MHNYTYIVHVPQGSTLYMCICVLAHPLAGSSAIPLGTLDDDRVKSVRRCPLSRSSTEIVSGVASVQYSLFVIQSIAKPSFTRGV